jgi:hypothetical protein
MRAVWTVHDRTLARRVRAVAKCWPRWQAGAEEVPLRHDNAARAAFWLGFAAFQAIAALAPSPPGDILSSLWGPVAAVLSPLFLLSGWLLDLDVRRQGWDRGPAVLVRLRAALACLPLVGFFVVPASRWLAGRQGGWLATGSVQAPALDLRRGALTLHARAERQLARLFVLRHLYLWILAGQMPAVLAGAAWLSRAGAAGGPLAVSRIGAVVVLHGVALASLYHAALGRIERFRLEGWRALLLRAAPVATVVPLPFWPSLLVPLLWVGAPGSAAQRDGLVATAWGSLSRTVIFPPELRQEKSLRRRIGHARLWSWMKLRVSVDDSAEDRRLGSLYRWQTFLVLIDATALGSWGVGPGPHSPLTGWLEVWWILIGLAFLFQLLVLAGRLAGFLSRSLYAQPYARYLALAHSALFGGFLAGHLLRVGNMVQLGQWISQVGKFGLLGGVYFLPVAAAARRFTPLVSWSLGFLAMTGLGRFLQTHPQATWLLPPLRAAVFAAPLWHLAVAATLGCPVAHTPTGRRSPACRLLAALVAVSGWIPFGGLAIPLWIYLRQRWRRDAVNNLHPAGVYQSDLPL